MRFRAAVGAVVLAAAWATGCRSPLESISQTAMAQTPDSSPGDAVPARRDADDVARFIAGMPGTPGSPFAELEATDAWKEHRQRLDEAWRRAGPQLIDGLREFQKSELDDSALRQSAVFYPFGGPDSLTMTLLFPHNPLYVMVGLEPAGTLPRAAQLGRKDLTRYLAETRETVASELGRSFFITRQMDREFRGQVTDGLILPILHLLVRTGHSVVGFRYVRLDDQGNVIERAADYHAPGRIGNKGIEIEFRSDGETATHRLFYFTVNLADDRLNENPAFLSYVGRMQGVTTLLKATSYMTHKRMFSTIRQAILDHSTAILQDDSGVPYRFFETPEWRVQLYGEYSRPYGSFRWMEQPNLRKAFASGAAKPLTLRIGYGYSKIASNLLLARRADTRSAQR